MAEDFMTADKFTVDALDGVIADFESGKMTPFLDLDVADEPEFPEPVKVEKKADLDHDEDELGIEEL